MRSVKNDQYEYINHIQLLYDGVAARIGREMEKRYRLPDIVHIDEEEDTVALVLAPHQDDEVLGCGGTLHKLVASGAKVKVAYMTDGRFGNLDNTEAEIIAIREREARDGLRVLGINDAVFHKISDLCLECDHKTVALVKDAINKSKANVLFVPHPHENHPDHWTTAQIAAVALNGHDRCMNVFQYEVWTPFVPNTLVDITGCMELKIRALREHQSQIKMIDYAEKIRGLNSYRSINANSDSRYCEAFIRSTSKDFIRQVADAGLC